MRLQKIFDPNVALVLQCSDGDFAPSSSSSDVILLKNAMYYFIKPVNEYTKPSLQMHRK